MRKEIEKLLKRTVWQIESIGRSLEQEKEIMVREAQRGNTNYVEQCCKRIDQLNRDLEVFKQYRYEFEGILNFEVFKGR